MMLYLLNSERVVTSSGLLRMLGVTYGVTETLTRPVVQQH
jgi:hypothetical protein